MGRDREGVENKTVKFYVRSRDVRIVCARLYVSVLDSRPVTVHSQLLCTVSTAPGALSQTRQLRVCHAQKKDD